MIREINSPSNRFRLALLVVVLCLAVQVGAESNLFTYQCRLTDEGGIPLTDPMAMVFSIYDSPSGGTVLWYEDPIMVDPDEQGLITVNLGEYEPLDGIFSNLGISDYWLEIAIQPPVGDEVVLSPRRPINSAPLAMFAGDSRLLQGHGVADFSLAGHDHSGEYAATDHDHEGDYAPVVHDHDESYFTESELSTSDGNAPNTGSNRVSWNNLTDVPADFADGSDETGGTVSLDAAYDAGGSGAGRTIDANAGPVRIQGSGGLEVAGDVTLGDPAAAATLRIEGDQTIAFYPNSVGTGSVILPEDAIYDVEIRDEPGIANGHGSSLTFGGDQDVMVDLCTATITTPEWGYILVMGTSTCCLSGTPSQSNTIYHQVDETEGGLQGTSYQFLGYTNFPGNLVCHSISSTRLFPKPAGTYTFRYEAMSQSATGTKEFYNSKIEVIYLPTAYGSIVYAFTDDDPLQERLESNGDRR